MDIERGREMQIRAQKISGVLGRMRLAIRDGQDQAVVKQRAIEALSELGIRQEEAREMVNRP